MSKEIEKKYLLSEIDKNILENPAVINQGYVFTENGEMRIRQKDQKFFITVKGDGKLTRNEWEKEIPEWVFKIIWPNTHGKRVEKTRYSKSYGKYVLEIDAFKGDLKGLLLLECEFSSIEEANSFKLPEWAKSAKNVTNDKRYKNKNLAIEGRPKN